MTNQAEILAFFKNTNKLFRKNSFKKIIEMMDNIDDKLDDSTMELMEFIVFIVSIEFRTSVGQIKSRSKAKLSGVGGCIADARKMCFVLIKKNTKLDTLMVASYFDRSKRYVNRVLREFRLMNKNMVYDAEFIRQYEQLTKKIEEFNINTTKKTKRWQ